MENNLENKFLIYFLRIKNLTSINDNPTINREKKTNS